MCRHGKGPKAGVGYHRKRPRTMPDTPATFPQPGDRPAVLVTRPQPGADRLAAVLRGHGLTVLVAPLMRVVAVAHDNAALTAARGLVFTSAHAIAAAGPGLGRPAICVGPATAEAARRAGFDVTSGPGDAAGLMPLLRDLGEGWLHPRGVHVAAELPVPGIVVYDQRLQPLGEAARALLDQTRPVIVPVMSPRSARIAADAFARYGKGRHPAGLNFGDCFAYACAKEFQIAMLFKGNDFSQTDIERA